MRKAQTCKKTNQEKNSIEAFFKVSNNADKKIIDHEGTGRKNIDYEQSAEMFNMIAKWIFALSVVIFNVVFWAYSISQYVNAK